MAHHSLCVPLFHSLAELAKAVRIQREAQLLQLLHLQDLQLATLHRLLQALPKGLGNLLVLLALLPLDSFLAGYMGPEGAFAFSASSACSCSSFRRFSLRLEIIFSKT